MGASTRPTRKPGRKAPVTRRGVLAILVSPALSRACQLDRQADLELAHGRHSRAEALAQQAAELRGWA